MEHELLRIPPPIHTEEDPASPPPASILLDPYGYLSRRVNGTTAEGFRRGGESVLVTFWVATPPRASCFTVHCQPSVVFGGLPTALYSEDDLVLLRLPIHRRHADYFVYQAGTNNNPPSLKLLPPIPRDFRFSDSGIVLLRCRDQDAFYFAMLRRVIDLKCDGDKFDLHMYNSKTGAWSTELMLVHLPNSTLSYSYPNIAIAMGGEFGSVAWVDLWRGILICDLLRDNHSLRYIPVPLPLVPRPLRGYPLCFRNIIVLEGYIKYFEMCYSAMPGSNTGCTCAAAQSFVAATKKMKISDIGSGSSNWEDDCAFNFSEVPVDSLKFAQMMPQLKQVTNTKLTLKRLRRAGYPALSLHEADVVYIMHRPDLDKDKASVIAVDMRNKTLKDVADFGSGRPLGYTFTYLQSGISKHLSS